MGDLYGASKSSDLVDNYLRVRMQFTETGWYNIAKTTPSRPYNGYNMLQYPCAMTLNIERVWNTTYPEVHKLLIGYAYTAPVFKPILDIARAHMFDKVRIYTTLISNNIRCILDVHYTNSTTKLNESMFSIENGKMETYYPWEIFDAERVPDSPENVLDNVYEYVMKANSYMGEDDTWPIIP